jgi:Zn-dependent protease
LGLDVSALVIVYVCFLFSLSVHEAAHAYVTDSCGDPTPRMLGRITLNPLRHMDIMGTVALPLIMLFNTGGMIMGWAKPVPFNPRNLGNVRRDPMLIALAGPGSNLMLALFTVLVARLLMALEEAQVIGELPRLFLLALVYMVVVNVILLAFNLIPVPPLDGHHILRYFLPPRYEEMLMRIGPYGILIALVVVTMTPFFEYVSRFVMLPLLHLAGLPGLG